MPLDLCSDRYPLWGFTPYVLAMPLDKVAALFWGPILQQGIHVSPQAALLRVAVD